MFDQDPKILAALAAAVASVLVALLSFVTTRANQRDLERLKADLAERKSDADAKRSYTFEALKRLYSQYEPIRFHLVEACESAVEAIQQLADVALLRDSENVGSLPKGTYLRIARVYHLLLPAVYFKVMQSRLTLVDLEASRPAYLQYLLAKHGCSLLMKDREIAAFFGLMYTPYVRGWLELRAEDPQRFRRQGLPYGRLDNAVRAFLLPEDDKSHRIISFGEFESLVKSVESPDYSSPLGAALDLFDEFAPQTRPVLWRTLLIQFVAYKLFIFAARTGTENEELVLRHARSIELELSKLCGSSELAGKVMQFTDQHVISRVIASYKTPTPFVERTAAGDVEN